MTGLTPYIHFPGTARSALTFYAKVFGATTQLHTYGDFGRDDGPPDAIAHGVLVGGPVGLFGADAASGQPTFASSGLMMSLLGTASPSTLREWFSQLSVGGRVVDELQVRPWGASDGQVIDQFGLHWLIGFENGES